MVFLPEDGSHRKTLLIKRNFDDAPAIVRGYIEFQVLNEYQGILSDLAQCRRVEATAMTTYANDDRSVGWEDCSDS